MWIKEYRKKYGLSREELGRLAKCSGELIHILEQGGITHPGIADRIASICNVGRNERNSIVDGSHWRAGWKATPKYRTRGEKAEKAYFLRLAREKKAKELAEQQRLQAKQSEGAEQPGQPTKRERGSATSPSNLERSGNMPGVAATQSEIAGQPTTATVYAIDRSGHVIGQYAGCAAAAWQYGVKPRTVENRCGHRIGNTNEYSAGGVTFRYAAEWDGLSDDERLKRAVDAAGTTWSRGTAGRIGREYSWQGQTHSVAEWARIAGMSRQTLRSRLAGGWDIEKALKTPVMNGQK